MLRHLKIRSKLVLILLVPIMAIVALAAQGIIPRLSQATDAKQVAAFSRLAGSISPLIHELQDERGLTGVYLATKADNTELVKQHTQTDTALNTFGKAFESIVIQADLARVLDIAQADLAGLPDLRQHVLAGDESAADATDSYDVAITKLFDVLDVYSSETSFKSLELHRLASANFEVSEVKENLAQVRSIVTDALFAGKITPDGFARIETQYALMAGNLDQFNSDADPADRARYLGTQGGPDLATAHAVEAKVVEVGGGGAGVITGDPLNYYQSAASATDNLVAVEISTNNALTSRAEEIAATAKQNVLKFGVGSLGSLMIALFLALVVGRSLTRPLRRLTLAATDVAQERLPAMVEAIQNGQQVDTALPRLDVRSRDEIGQLTTAFNAVQRVAMDVTTEQASLRKSIGDMFVNLGRRNQSLIDRQLELIDELEATERDADSLQNLFALDHLVTRMRRNAENLLVLSGEEPPRKWGSAVPLLDVLRAAVSEVQDYARVDVSAPEDLLVGGHVATDIAHLVAELVENATNFSPPTTRIKVRVERAENRTLVSVIDQGIGMTDADMEAANSRLANPPSTDLTLARCLGFYVIGRLARRTGAAVRLGRSNGGGVLAQVALGSDLVSLSGQPVAAETHDSLTDSPSATRDRLLGALGTPADERSSRASRLDAPAPRPVETGVAPGPSNGQRPDMPLPVRGANNAAASSVMPVTGPQASPHAPLSPSSLPSRRATPPAVDGAGAAAAPLAPTPPPPPVAGSGRGAAPQVPVAQASPVPAPVWPARTPLSPVPAPPPSLPPVGSWPPPPGATNGTGALPREFAFPAPAKPADGPSNGGLPQRRAGASPRPGAQQPTSLLAPGTPRTTERSPEEVRAMLSRFRSGVERGRTVPAAGDRPDDPEETR